MANIETTKATIIPVKSIIISEPVKTNPNFSILSKLAPNITGMARKNVNSAAMNLEVPSSIAPIIVAPDLEVPGIRAKTWKTPMRIAVLYVSSEKLLIDGLQFLFLFSTKINKTPYIMRVSATVW